MLTAPNYVQGQYSVAERDRIFSKADSYPPAAEGLTNQVPTLTADGTIIWRNQSSGGEDGTANANIATVEPEATASQAYAVGALLVYSGQLYRVTAAIAQGGTITPGTNVSPTTVATAKQDITNYSAADINQYLAMVAAVPSTCGFTPVIGKGINLLDNWYFVGGGSQQGGGQFPINQRGQTEYTSAGYAIDRWKNINGGVSTIENDCICFTPANIFQRLNQIVENGTQFNGKTFTLSVLYKTTAEGYIIGASYKPGGYSIKGTTLQAAANWNLAYLTATSDLIEEFSIDLCRSSDSVPFAPVYIKAVKLELGDTQTLAHQENGVWVLNDPPPNYQQELAKCQRYFLPVRQGRIMGTWASNAFSIFVPTPVTMRVSPSVNVKALGTLASPVTLHAVSSINNTGSVISNGVNIVGSTSDTAASNEIIVCLADAQFDLSADL